MRRFGKMPIVMFLKREWIGVLSTIIEIITVIEWIHFWWINNGLHTSTWDFFLLHPIHSIVTTIIFLLASGLVSYNVNRNKKYY